MTDGIIQEVFNKYLELMLLRNIQAYAFDTVRELQQELIEKIKQEFNQHFDCLDHGCTLKTHIIGDNQ